MPPHDVKLEGYETLPADPAVQLDDISVRLKKITDIMLKQQEIMLQTLNVSILNQQHIATMKKFMEDWDDVGEYQYVEGVASTTPFTHNFIKDYHFPVKGFIFYNDGDTTIEIGWTSDKLLDVSEERFGSIAPGESFTILNKGKKIRKLIVRTAAGTSNYRMWVVW